MSFVRIVLFAALFAQSALAAERNARFSINNMTCALCPITVKSVMSRLPGVISVEVNLELARATVDYDDTRTTADEIAAASTNAGYPATVVQTE